jgi:hypothetical protein
MCGRGEVDLVDGATPERRLEITDGAPQGRVQACVGRLAVEAQIAEHSATRAAFAELMPGAPPQRSSAHDEHVDVGAAPLEPQAHAAHSPEQDGRQPREDRGVLTEGRPDPRKPRPLLAEYWLRARLTRSHSPVATTSTALATFQWKTPSSIATTNDAIASTSPSAVRLSLSACSRERSRSSASMCAGSAFHVPGIARARGAMYAWRSAILAS